VRDYKSEPKNYGDKRRALEKKGHDHRHHGEYKSSSRSRKLTEEHRARHQGSDKYMPRLSHEEIKQKESSKKEDKSKRKTSSLGENFGESSQRKGSDARKSKNVASKQLRDRTDKKSRKVKEELGSGREEGELESSDEDDDEDPYADQTKFR